MKSTPRKNTLTLELSREQFKRLEVLAKMVHSAPAEFAVACIFANLSSERDWEEFHAGIFEDLDYYVKNGNAVGENRIEDLVPERIQRFAGYTPEVAGAEVAS